MNKVIIQLRDVQLSQLNTECLRLVAKFVRQLKAHKGVSLRMQDSDILVQISTQAHRTKNKQLKALYVDLKQEILKSLHHSMEPR
jgi:ribosomal silencing factor RsfS